MYELRKVALEARRNKPDLNNHYTKIKVPHVIPGFSGPLSTFCVCMHVETLYALFMHTFVHS